MKDPARRLAPYRLFKRNEEHRGRFLIDHGATVIIKRVSALCAERAVFRIIGSEKESARQYPAVSKQRCWLARQSQYPVVSGQKFRSL
jgi:hypothetical protein